tara:strand:+ start:3332 stop:3745 length:414 start_codon:yes stop_codon:yes gene_type:complete
MSTIKTNTLTGTTTAGSISVTGEGNSTTTNLQQGLVKVWLHYDQKGDSGSTQALDSFNVGSITDSATGQYEVNVTNNFNNAFHATGAICIDSGTQALFSSGPESNSSTSMIDMLSYTAGGSLADGDSSTNITCGDLA